MENTIEFSIEPISEKYSPNDNRWLDQVNDLVADFQSQVGQVRKELTAEEGAKGCGIELLFELLPVAIPAMVQVFRGWLTRDRTRSLKISIKKNGEVQVFVLEGKGMSEETIKVFMDKAISLEGAKS